MSALEGRSAIVTGGGSGIGAAIALRLAQDGAAVAICGRTEAKLEKVAASIREMVADSFVRTVVADVTDEAAVSQLVAASLEATGDLDIVVANAGGGGMLGPYHLQDAAEFARVLQLNVMGTMLLVKHSVPHLINAGGGAFVAVSSIAGGTTHPYFGAYPVAKAGVEQIVRNAADEYGHATIRFNAIRPGFVATEIMQAIPQDSAVYQDYVSKTPLGRLGTPEDVAGLVSFLAGPQATWLTGQVIGIDGGHSLRSGPDFGAMLAPVLGAENLRPTQ